MPFSTRNVRIGGASILAIVFVGFGYVLSGPSFLSSKVVSAASSDELLKAYALKDSDGDGLPDWQEAIYGTDPNKKDTDGDGMSDLDALTAGKLTPQTLSKELPKTSTKLTSADLPGIDPAPGSITDEFSKELFQEYIAESKGQPMSAEAQQALVSKLMRSFSTRAGKLLESKYTLVSVHTGKNADVLTYAGTVERILRAHDVPAGNGEPLPLIEALVEKGDTTARPKLVLLADMYAAITKDLLATTVPPALASDHLLLIQSFDTLARSTRLVANYEKDPVGVLGALSLYQPYSKLAVTGFSNIAEVILASGDPESGTPGALIVKIARDAQTQ